MQIRGLSRLLPDRDSTGSCLDSSKLNRGQVKKDNMIRSSYDNFYVLAGNQY